MIDTDSDNSTHLFLRNYYRFIELLYYDDGKEMVNSSNYLILVSRDDGNLLSREMRQRAGRGGGVVPLLQL